MNKHHSDLTFPGQEHGTVKVYIKPSKKELHIQLELALYDSLEETL